MTNNDKISGIEELRKIVRYYDNCIEDFNYRYSLPQLIRLYRIAVQTGWDITPDEWTDWQVKDALEYGIIPQWDKNEQPVYQGTSYGE